MLKMGQNAVRSCKSLFGGLLLVCVEALRGENQSMNMHNVLVLTTVSALFFGCSEGIEVTEPSEDDVSEVMNTFVNTRDFELVRGQRLQSVVKPGIYVNVFTSPEILDDYERIQPLQSGSGVSLPLGTMIVREVLDEDTLEAEMSTVMFRTEEDNGLGGWIFGVFEPNGEPRLDELGVPRVGNLVECVGCHSLRPQDNYLFGAPLPN